MKGTVDAVSKGDFVGRTVSCTAGSLLAIVLYLDTLDGMRAAGSLREDLIARIMKMVGKNKGSEIVAVVFGPGEQERVLAERFAITAQRFSERLRETAKMLFDAVTPRTPIDPKDTWTLDDDPNG